MKVGSLVADNYGGNQDWSVGVILEIDTTTAYGYKICYPDENDTDWYNQVGAFNMFVAYKNLVGENLDEAGKS